MSSPSTVVQDPTGSCPRLRDGGLEAARVAEQGSNRQRELPPAKRGPQRQRHKLHRPHEQCFTSGASSHRLREAPQWRPPKRCFTGGMSSHRPREVSRWRSRERCFTGSTHRIADRNGALLPEAVSDGFHYFVAREDTFSNLKLVSMFVILFIKLFDTLAKCLLCGKITNRYVFCIASALAAMFL